MPGSIRLRELSSRITELRERLLPRTFDPTGSYSDRVYDRVLGFRVLAHAEIEACIEDLGMATAQAAYDAWQTRRAPSLTLITLLAYYEGSLGAPPDEIAKDRRSLLRERVSMVRNHYIRAVRIDNHGIRERNVLSVFLPVGILDSDLDRTWLSTIDSFGAVRGETAHRTRRTQQPPDPAQELQTVRAIVDGIGPIDQKLAALRSV